MSIRAIFLVLSLQVALCATVRADDLDHVRKVVHQYEGSGDIDTLAMALAARDATFYNYGMSDSVLHYTSLDMERLKGFKKWKQYFEVWMYRINTYIYYNNQKSLALREVQAMREESKELDYKYGMGIAYYTMGNVYYCMGSLDESADAYKKGLDILSEITPLPPVIPELYSSYGDVLNEQRKYEQLRELTVRWRTFLEIFIPANELTDSENDIFWFYYDIACAQAALGQNDTRQAEKMLQEAHKHIPLNMDFLERSWLSHMAQLRMKQGSYLEAFQLNNRRMDMVEADEDKYSYIGDLVQRAEILSHLGQHRESALLYRDLYLTFDSINRADTKSQLAEMNTIFQVDELKMQQERELYKLNMQQEREQFRLMMVIVGIIVLALVIFTVFRMMAARRLKKAHDQLQETHDELLTAYDQLEETTAAKERIESDLRIARNIQMGMVPRNFPKRDDLDIYGCMTPAKEVGGDLYGYHLVPANADENKPARLYFCLGDVSGKGVPASLFMAQATRLFRTLAAQEMMPSEIATRINDALSGEDNETCMFVTMFLGLIDLSTGHLYFCNAGHNPPILLKDGKTEFIKMLPNTPIGLFPGLEYEGEEIADISNCPFFVYTDGLNEAENRKQEQFTDERLLEIMEDRPFESCQQTVEMLRDEVERHRDGAEPNDDLTMLCVKVIRQNTK